MLSKYEHLIGGVSGGLTSTLACHPMDLLKIRYSANEGNPMRPQYKNYLDATRKIVEAEGFRGLYQGLTPNLVGATMSWGLYFHFYHWIKSNIIYKSPFELVDNFIYGFLSGSAVMCITNPIWVTKTRLCLQYESSGPKKYKGMLDCLAKMYREEGMRGYYRGFVPGLMGTTHGALQFMVYNRLKDRRCKALGLEQDSQLSTTDYLLYSSISKIIATSVTYPYQVLRTRMQDHNVQSRGVFDTIRHTLRGEGVAGLYKGMLMANIRQLPAALVTFLTYENVKHLIRDLDSR